MNALFLRTAIALAASLYLSARAATPTAPQSVADVRVFAVYEPVFSAQDVELLARVHPDLVCRGWFKWHHTPNWSLYAPLAQACRDKGILLQGGITVAALYPGENGIDDATFQDYVCRGTDGQPYFVRCENGGWYHLSLYNPKVVETLKRDVHREIDAGAAGIWYDEIEGYYDWNPTEGYEPRACVAFRDWLIRKYVDGQGWRDDDPRWRSQFGIDLSQHGGSIRSFDYLRHLQTTPGRNGQPLAANPPQGHPRAWAISPNPLYREWGFAWDRKAAGTFRFDTAAAAFADLVADADRYARERYGRTLINTYNHNGTARPGVAFLQPHNGAQPPLRHGRLDGRTSAFDYYARTVADAAEACPGQPVVFFVDWPGETDRLAALPRPDQTLFFRLYIPEAYAAGGEFALPLRGYCYVAARQGTLAALARLADFYRAYAPFLRGSRALPQQPEPVDRLTACARATAAGTAVHLVNHAFSTSEVWPISRSNLTVRIPWSGPAPAAAFAVSPDFPEQRPVALALKDGRLTLDVGMLTCSALVLLPKPAALRPVSGAAADGTHLLDPQGRALAVARNGRFTLWLPPERIGGGGLADLVRRSVDAPVIECLETGERQPARDGAAFAPPPPGPFVSGLLLDSCDIPARHATLAHGSQRWRTDAWGRFRLPLAACDGGPLTSRIEPNHEHAFTPTAAFSAWRAFAPRTPVVALASNTADVAGFWGNWPDKEHTPGVIEIVREPHGGRDALRVTFSPTPNVSWSNANSPGFALTDSNAVEIDYAGDGSARTVHATLHAHPRFYRAVLTLADAGWTRRRIPLAEFRDDAGRPFDPAAHTGSLDFQLSPMALGAAPATLWLGGVALVNESPVRQRWTSEEAFDDVDVDHLLAEHRPQPPPPAATSRQPLARFADPAASYLANWDGKGSDDKRLVAIEHIATPGAAPFLRVTLAPGACAWGNANIPLPVDALAGRDGLALRLRAAPADADVELALHTSANGQAVFYRADVEAAAAWTDAVLPWSEFRLPNGQAFAPQAAGFVLLQVCRPGRDLARAITVDLEAIDTVTLRR